MSVKPLLYQRNFCKNRMIAAIQLRRIVPIMAKRTAVQKLHRVPQDQKALGRQHILQIDTHSCKWSLQWSVASF